MECLTHCRLAAFYGDIHLDQHWLREWLAAWRHQAITKTNIYFSATVLWGVYIIAKCVHEVNPWHMLRDYNFEIITTSSRNPWVDFNIPYKLFHITYKFITKPKLCLACIQWLDTSTLEKFSTCLQNVISLYNIVHCKFDIFVWTSKNAMYI